MLPDAGNLRNTCRRHLMHVARAIRCVANTNTPLGPNQLKQWRSPGAALGSGSCVHNRKKQYKKQKQKKLVLTNISLN
jgi:hypothetical protein